jgi:hypothetical protein
MTVRVRDNDFHSSLACMDTEPATGRLTVA